MYVVMYVTVSQTEEDARICIIHIKYLVKQLFLMILTGMNFIFVDFIDV